MEEKKIYYEIITAAWGLLKDYYAAPDWNAIPLKGIEISNKYKNTKYFKFACGILAEVTAEINRRENEE